MATAGPVTASTAQPAPAAAGAQAPGARAADEPRYTVSVCCKVDGEAAQVSFTTFRRTLIQQIMDSSLAFFKISPSQSQTAQLVLGGKQVISFSAQSTVEDLKLTTPDRQSLELVLLDEEPEVTFPVRDQYGNEELLRARLYHPFVDAVRRLLDPDSPALQAQPPAPVPAPAPATNTSAGGSSSQQNQQQPHGLDVDLYRSSDVSLISLQNSPAACGLQGGEPLLLYRYGRCSREYWQGLGQPDRGLKPTFAGLYISDYKNQFQGRAVFRHDLAMPLEYLLSTYCKWRGIEKDKASFLWLQFYMRLSSRDTGLARGMDDGDTIYIFDKQDPQGKLWDGVLDGNVEAVRLALDEGSSLEGPEGSFEAITSRWPLHAAAANNHLSVAEALVERGADVDKLDAVSEPALWHAVEQGHGEMVALLLKLGATASDLPCPPGKTKADYAALCHAAEKGSLAMVQLLLDKGANPYTYDDTGYCAYDYLVDQAKPLELLRALLNADGAFSTTQKSYQQAYQRLCAAVKRAQRYPALGCNCRTCNSVVEVRAAEAEATQTLKSQIGCVALVRAVQAGGPHCLEAMQLLHTHGALLDGQDQDGRTALHQAIRYNRLAEAKWLVTAGAHLDVADFEGLLPLHQAACTGNVEFARLLVEAGAPINLHTVKYITQESLEAQTKKQEAGSGGRKAAKKRNALDVTGLTTIGGNSALALAVRHGHAAVVEYLLSQQASFDLKNPADSSAFHAALDRGAASVASKLLQHLNKPKPGKMVAGGNVGGGNSTAIVASSGPPTVSKVKSKDTATSKDKAARKASLSTADASCKVGASAAAGGGTAGQSTSDSDGGGGPDVGKGGDVSSPEPALAVDAGAGLREIVQQERERLRQEKGLGRAATTDTSTVSGGAANALKAAPSLMQQLEALKAAEKAQAAKHAAEQQALAEKAAKARAVAESQAAEELERKQLEEAARVKAEEALRKRVEEEDRRREEDAAVAAAAARRRAEDAARAKADATAEAASAPATKVAATGSGGRAGAQGNSRAAAAPASVVGALQPPQEVAADAADLECSDAAPAAAKPPGVQILFRSTSTALPAASAKQQQPVPAIASIPSGPAVTTPAASGSKTARANSSAASTAPADSKTQPAAAATLTTSASATSLTSAVSNPSAKKGKGKGKGGAAAGDADHAAPSPSSVPNTPSKHSAAEHGHKQGAAPGTTGKRGAGKAAAAASATPTAAALAASAALSHSTAVVSRSSGGTQQQQHSNGPAHHGGYDGGYNGGYGEDHMHHGGHSHTATPGLSPRHGHLGSSAATTPVRSSKPPSRRNSFSSGSLSALQQGWPGHQQSQQQQHPLHPQQQHQQQMLGPDPQQQGLFSAGPGGHSAAGLRMPPGIMVSGMQGQQGGGVQGLSDSLGGPGLHMAPHHHLSPLRHSPPGPRVPASGTPTGAQDDTGLWDDAGHLESFVMSVVTDITDADKTGPVSNGGQQQHASGRTSGAQHHLQQHGKREGGDASNSPFKLHGMPQGAAGAAAAWDMGPGTVHHNSGGSNGTPRAPPPGIPQRANTAPQGMDRVPSADGLLAAMAGHQHLPSDAGGTGRGATTRPGGLGIMGVAADEPFAGWMRGGQQGGDGSGWPQQQGTGQQGSGAAGGHPPGWGSWMQQGSGGGSSDMAGSTGQKQAAGGSTDSVSQSLGASSSGLGLNAATTLLAGAAPFVPGEPSHWQASASSSASQHHHLGASAGAPRELDPLPHLPASLFEDDGDMAPMVLEPPQSGRGQQGSGQQGGQQGGGGGGGQQGSGMGQQGGRGAQGAGGGGMQGGNRPSSRGRPSAALHTRTASAGNSQDGSVAAAGRYPATGAGVRMPMGQYSGLAPSGVPQPSLPGLYANAQQEVTWYPSQQAGWQQQGQGYPAGMAGVPPSPQHGMSVQAPHTPSQHAHPAAAMYQVLSSMGGGGGGGAGWGDAAAAGGQQMNGYWPGMPRGSQGMGELMGVTRGRGVAPSQGQPPRYRQH